ncbi:hypothetical protein C6401_13960 [Arthrobacter woluwensis]|uniref:sigma-70 family RNA polymerase sigma factor n=1 Tax=Arthrobacter woluwensis TaxID=156980 RepID=UPI000D4C2F56|nr:sigma-70 family RNA polymerase sigma factor [Arthrobacter woluwensis]PSS43145.1 hypothetical protein C6401_13960 [Arthrobacter woluwensis]
MPKRIDSELLTLARAGDMDAFGALFAKHRDTAYRLAYALTQDHGAAEDAVNETFASVLSALKSGRGPQGVFLPYLLSSVSRTVWRSSRRKRREVPSDDISPLEEAPDASDRVLLAFENESARRALLALPDRWRMIIWYLDVEDLSPRDIAPTLGLSANATVALHRRAKTALRAAYLAEHLGKQGHQDCQFTIGYVPAYLTGTLTHRKKTWFHEHLKTCPHCRRAFAEILDSGVFRVAPENRPPGWPWANCMLSCIGFALLGLLTGTLAASYGGELIALLNRISSTAASQSSMAKHLLRTVHCSALHLNGIPLLNFWLR